METLLSALHLAVGKKTHSHLFLPVTFTVRPSRLLYFAEWGLAHGKALPSVREMALGKACFAIR